MKYDYTDPLISPTQVSHFPLNISLPTSSFCVWGNALSTLSGIPVWGCALGTRWQPYFP